MPLESAEIEEMLDMMELIDSFESRLLKGSEGRLGGSAGDGWVEFFRGGNRGGGVGFGGWVTFYSSTRNQQLRSRVGIEL